MKEKLKKAYEFSNSWTGTIIIVLLIIFFIAQAFVIPSGSMKRTLLIGDHLFVKKFAYGIATPHIPWLEIPVVFDFDGDGHIIKGEGPKRGDIVVFRYPRNEKIYYVKRCFATAGDELIFISGAIYLRPKEGDEFIKKNYPKERIVTLNSKLWVKNPMKDKYPGIHYFEADKNAFEIMVNLYLSNPDNVDMKPILVEDLPQYSGLNFNAFYKKVEKERYYMIGDNRDNSNDSRFWGSVPYRLIVGKPWFIYFSWNKNYEVRWERVGRDIESMQLEKDFIDRYKAK